MCGKYNDSLRHRLFLCPAVETLRRKVVSRTYIKQALAAASVEDMLLYYRGIMLHPRHPQPDSGTDAIEIIWHDPQEQDKGFTGDLFTDGACTQHVIPELTRAATGVVLLDEQGNRRASIQKPVPRHYPQSAPAAEFLAANIAHQLAQKPATIHTDCLNVYKAMQALPQVYTKSPYVGIMAEVSRRNKHTDIEWAKVKSHLDPTAPMITEVERRKRLGNDWADKTAKKATEKKTREV